MATEKLAGPELKKMVKLAKKQPLAFAFCPGAKTDQSVVMIDRRKSPTMLGKSAKAEGTSPKVAFGTMSVSGKLMQLTCERVVPKMAKSLKTYLRSQKVMVNVVILDETGTELESDVEDLPDDPEFDAVDADDAGAPEEEAQALSDEPPGREESDEEPQEQEDDDAQRARALAARLKAVQPAVMDAPAETGEKLRKVMGVAVGQIKAGDLDKAEQAVTALEGAVARLGPEASQAPGAPQDSDGAPPDDPQDGPQPDARALAARAGALKQAIDGIDEPAKGKLMAALGTAAKAIKAGELTSADAQLTRLEEAANKVMAQQGAAQGSPAPDAPSADAQKWATAESRLQPLVDKAMAERRGDLDAINRAFAYAKDLAADGAYDRALAAAGKVAELLKAAATMSGTAAAAEAQEAAPADVVAYTRSRLNWIKTRDDLKKEVATLKSAIDSATADVEGLEDVSSKSGILFTYLDDIDSKLEDTLERLVEAPDGDRREELKGEARRIIDDYRGVLGTDFFQAVDTNGFVQTNIRGAALASLAEVQTALTS